MPRKNRGIAKQLIDYLQVTCADWRKASSIGINDSVAYVIQGCQ